MFCCCQNNDKGLVGCAEGNKWLAIKNCLVNEPEYLIELGEYKKPSVEKPTAVVITT